MYFLLAGAKYLGGILLIAFTAYLASLISYFKILIFDKSLNAKEKAELKSNLKPLLAVPVVGLLLGLYSVKATIVFLFLFFGVSVIIFITAATKKERKRTRRNDTGEYDGDLPDLDFHTIDDVLD